ncbi:MAG: rhomboid family intramembrane serine protease [Elusimicrobiales bacterium]|nr:rhomboid family intramembrane serine protease [Elusimicrobiales bacterium]
MAEAHRRITAEMLAEDPFRPGPVDFEKDMSVAPAFALALIGANVLAFAWELRSGALQSPEAIVAAGAIYRDKVFGGQAWRLVTGMFLHGGYAHLIGNCVALYVLGLAAQRAWGRSRALLIYFAGGAAASFVSALAQTRPAVGASGAIFALMGAVVVFFFRNRGALLARSRRIGAGLLGWGLFQLALGLLSPYVDNWAHFGGLAAGAALGLVLPAALLAGPEPSVQG